MLPCGSQYLQSLCRMPHEHSGHSPLKIIRIFCKVVEFFLSLPERILLLLSCPIITKHTYANNETSCCHRPPNRPKHYLKKTVVVRTILFKLGDCDTIL